MSDGSREGRRWLPDVPLAVVMGTFLSQLVTFGPLYAFSIYVPIWKDHFEISLESAMAIHSLMISMQFVGSLFAGLLIPRRASHRTVAAAGSLLVLAGYLVVASAGSMPLMYLGMGPLVGLGLGACNLAGITALNGLAGKNRALAVGIATCGSSVGVIVLPPTYTGLMAAFGWRWSLRIGGLAASAALLAVAPLFWVPPSSSASGAGAPPPKTFRLPCQDARYLCWWLNTVLCFCGYFAPTTLLAQFAKDEAGASPEATSRMLSLLGCCALLTRLFLGCITRCAGGVRRVHLASTLAIGLATLVMPLCRSTAALTAWCACFGLSMGPLIPLISVILAELFGIDVLPLFQGVSRLGIGIGSLLGPPIVGGLVEMAGYGTAFAVAGAFVFTGSIFLVLMSWLQARRESAAAAPGAGKEARGTTELGQGTEVAEAASGEPEAGKGAERALEAAIDKLEAATAAKGAGCVQSAGADWAQQLGPGRRTVCCFWFR
mmetsp:Transcript_81088/g.229667  ORF Transcript_81088/g.229667 Transcript_81088/m.229667 type:complete len:490 (-) Transcript_81088:294-1763(-)|eukprot:CAMPEP_0168402880 /NCGR_PEP_ID=MMETSP0228-20121227/23843_1 /TAXON_ID=133427 /ORGANISM="Protoceratium reticulatum, Strain CCCM 535 (=CCMP 1889)" /LENGTH=489 /DNA_ID=CAMNT_0008416469 /DNA_START=52 /DNA_END=1521 /DNA_ORIENTATION=+